MAVEYRIIARVQKPHGTQGEVVCSAEGGLPFVVREGLEVWVVPPVLKVERRNTVTKVSPGPAGARVALSGIKALGDAEKIADRYLLARLDDLPEDLFLHDPGALVGIAVEDRVHGPLGEVVEVMQGPANDVWEVEGPYGTVLVPVVDEFIVDASPDRVLMDLPKGIVEEDT